MNNRPTAVREMAVAGVIMLLAGTGVSQISEEPDSLIEQCLSEGEVVKKEGKLLGITGPVRLRIECDGMARSVVFKLLDEHRRGITRLEGGATEFNFSDSYKYEVAAYLLDRELEMNMVPVAVLRRYRGDDGCFVDWIDNASTGTQLEVKPSGPQMAYLAGQKAVMRLFDALIYNVDRRPENWLVDHDTFKLYLIDHSRAFRESKDLPEEFASTRARLSWELYEALQELGHEHLGEVLGDLITNRQLEAVLERRDRILEKIDKERREYGDQIIFSDAEPSQDAPGDG